MKKLEFGAIATIIAAIITAWATLGGPGIRKFLGRNAQSSTSKPPVFTSFERKQVLKKMPGLSHSNVQNGDNDSLDDHSNNSDQQVGAISGNGNQVNQISGSSGVTINQLPPASPHPITFGMELKWTEEEFCETVEGGNLPAIKEYLNPKDGFDPNTLCRGAFALMLPIVEGRRNFPDILALFKETGRLNWNEVNRRSGLLFTYNHPTTQQFELLKEASTRGNTIDLKALIDAGANPTQFLADTMVIFASAPKLSAIYKGQLTGRARDASGAHAETELATFKSIGYPLPDLERITADLSRSPEICAQDIKSHHSFEELMALAKNPPQSQNGPLALPPYQKAAAILRDKLRFGPLAWQGDAVEYARAVASACSPNGSF